MCIHAFCVVNARERRERKPNATPFFLLQSFENLEKKKKKKKKETTTTSDDDFHDDDFVEQSRPIFAAIFGKKRRVLMKKTCLWRRTTRGRVEIRARKQGGSGTRPYTLRSGDTLESIASKRKLNVETLRNMNKKVGSNPKIGETILIPSGALSAKI